MDHPSGPAPLTRLSGIGAGLRRLAAVFLSAAIVGVTSERVFWFWATDPLDHLVVAAVYSLPVAGCLWAIGHYRVGGPWSLLLAAPLFAYLVEGVVTPVLYEAGPVIPLFPAWFSFWHGILGVVIAWYLVRRWLLDGRWRPLLATSIGLGTFWGLWSTTLWLDDAAPDRADGQPAGQLAPILEPGAFLLYCATFTAILASAHWLLGFVWTTRSEPRPLTRWLYGAVVVAVLVWWTVSIPWALPMFAAYTGLQVVALRRHRRTAAGPDLYHQLVGRVRVRSLWPLAAVPATAGATYAALWSVQPSQALLTDLVRTGTILTQSIIAVCLVGLAIVKVYRRSPQPLATAAASG